MPALLTPQTLLIDADDTLWENNVYFDQAIADFIERLNHQHLSPDEVRKFLYDVERETVLERGYGSHSFSNSLVKCFERLAEKPVTPAFLFAALLWEPVREEAETMIANGVEPVAAWASASDRVMTEQAQRVAVPRRFAGSIEEIWVLQPRFEQRVKKRVSRLLAHPRFRAAYDFLLLRSSESPALTELAEWWTAAQHMDQQELSRQFTPAPIGPDGLVERDPAAKRRRPRRRRRKAKSEAGPEGGTPAE